MMYFFISLIRRTTVGERSVATGRCLRLLSYCILSYRCLSYHFYLISSYLIGNISLSFNLGGNFTRMRC